MEIKVKTKYTSNPMTIHNLVTYYNLLHEKYIKTINTSNDKVYIEFADDLNGPISGIDLTQPIEGISFKYINLKIKDFINYKKGFHLINNIFGIEDYETITIVIATDIFDFSIVYAKDIEDNGL